MTGAYDFDIMLALRDSNRVQKLRAWMEGERLLRQYEPTSVVKNESLSWLRKHLNRLREEIDHANR